MADDPQRARVLTLLQESVDLYAAVAAVCRVLPEERAFAASVLKLDIATLDTVEARWKRLLERDAALELTFQALVDDYEWAFRQLRAGASPIVT